MRWLVIPIEALRVGEACCSCCMCACVYVGESEKENNNWGNKTLLFILFRCAPVKVKFNFVLLSVCVSLIRQDDDIEKGAASLPSLPFLFLLGVNVSKTNLLFFLLSLVFKVPVREALASSSWPPRKKVYTYAAFSWMLVPACRSIENCFSGNLFKFKAARHMVIGRISCSFSADERKERKKVQKREGRKHGHSIFHAYNHDKKYSFGERR